MAYAPSPLNVVIWLIVIVIILVVLFFLIDRFLLVLGGIGVGYDWIEELTVHTNLLFNSLR